MILKLNEDNLILPKDFCEIDYIEKIVSVIKTGLDDSYELYVIYEGYKGTISGSNKTKVAIHVGNETKFDNKLYKNFDVVFRFYLQHKCDYVKIFPINIGYNCSGQENMGLTFKNQKKLSERSKDVFFIGHSTKRASLIRALKKLKGDKYDIRITDGFRKGLDINDYLGQLGDAKICLVPRGMSPETFRYTEAFASGCIVITTEKVDAWFYKNSPAFFIKNWAKLTDSFINEILTSDIDKKYEENLQYYRDYLSPEANAAYILATLKTKPVAKKRRKWFGLGK